MTHTISLHKTHSKATLPHDFLALFGVKISFAERYAAVVKEYTTSLVSFSRIIVNHASRFKLVWVVVANHTPFSILLVWTHPARRLMGKRPAVFFNHLKAGVGIQHQINERAFYRPSPFDLAFQLHPAATLVVSKSNPLDAVRDIPFAQPAINNTFFPFVTTETAQLAIDRE